MDRSKPHNGQELTSQWTGVNLTMDRSMGFHNITYKHFFIILSNKKGLQLCSMLQRERDI
jgi:hypothetical protein